MSTPTDLAKIQALLAFVSATDGTVSLSGTSAADVAAAIGEVEQLRSDRDRLQALCDKTALAAANRVLNQDVPKRPIPTPNQWASWFQHCAAEADEMTEDHRKVFRLAAEHFEVDWIVRKVADITGVDS